MLMFASVLHGVMLGLQRLGAGTCSCERSELLARLEAKRCAAGIADAVQGMWFPPQSNYSPEHPIMHAT